MPESRLQATMTEAAKTSEHRKQCKRRNSIDLRET